MGCYNCQEGASYKHRNCHSKLDGKRHLLSTASCLCLPVAPREACKCSTPTSQIRRNDCWPPRFRPPPPTCLTLLLFDSNVLLRFQVHLQSKTSHLTSAVHTYYAHLQPTLVSHHAHVCTRIDKSASVCGLASACVRARVYVWFVGRGGGCSSLPIFASVQRLSLLRCVCVDKRST